jgi:hypothetical protein
VAHQPAVADIVGALIKPKRWWQDVPMAAGRSPRRKLPGERQIADGGAWDGDALAELRRLLAEAGAPEEAIRALNGTADPEQVLSRLIASGVLPDPEDALAGLLAGWEPLLAPGVDPLSAELAGCEFLAMVRTHRDEWIASRPTSMSRPR